ncbi:hypothetical protein C0995_010206 [Termitomyces sp. Mi166|nr:hypothetical protein C0995_010206 [Termitomyces sp. Mi166\
MAYWGPHQHGESSESSGGGGGPIQGPSQQRLVQLQGQQQNQPDYGRQCPYVENVAYPGHEEPLPYQSLYYSGGFGGGVAYGLQTGYSMVMQLAWQPRPLRQEHAPYMQPVNEVLLQRLEQAGQPVPAMAAFLQDSLAVVVLKGLLDQIEIMKRQHITVLEHIEHAGKCKAPVYKEPMVEPKQARAPVPTAVRPPSPPVQPPSSSAMSISFAVVVLTTDPRMPEQYNGLVATQQKTAATSKGKGKAVAMVDDESNYGQSSSEDEQESEKEELAAQRFQRMQ